MWIDGDGDTFSNHLFILGYLGKSCCIRTSYDYGMVREMAQIGIKFDLSHLTFEAKRMLGHLRVFELEKVGHLGVLTRSSDT